MLMTPPARMRIAEVGPTRRLFSSTFPSVCLSPFWSFSQSAMSGPFCKHFLSTYYVPGIVLRAGDPGVYKIRSLSHRREVDPWKDHCNKICW